MLDRMRCMTRHGTMIWVVACAAAMACAGCTFGDEPVQKAEPSIGNWFDQNCVPAECMYECCVGWNYYKKAKLRGGNVPGSECKKVSQTNPDYSAYVALMLEQWNWCSSEFASLESGTCYVVEPSDAIEGFRPDGAPVYSGLSFLVCPPKGQPLAYPMEDVELTSQE